ncbi:N-acetylmuramoyl-L-alanine amidase [Bartonella sp. HY038]|uniref:N-acetylmuramoyl-L-alanine amidase n=1 Tax=Bartonella sp. HY038 TaxID=2759660 RepID=UPI0015FC9287|nr:N-acetylmuramoyl-L-alanine amidase [Bartonella sp. HY038]
MTEVLDRPDFECAILRPSPNFNERSDNTKPHILILHYTGMNDAEAAESLLQDPASQVSCHYVVREDGTIVQMVAESKRAWHAGKSMWQGQDDINSKSIGIEIVNQGPLGNFPDFPSLQIKAVVELCQSIINRHNVGARYVLAHSDIAPERKIDPGEKFPWKDLADNGIGQFVSPSPLGGGRFMSLGESGRPVEAFQSMLALYGYPIEITGSFDENTKIVTEAFQRHFRPALVDGVADASTIDTLHRLLQRLERLS